MVEEGEPDPTIACACSKFRSSARESENVSRAGESLSGSVAIGPFFHESGLDSGRRAPCTAMKDSLRSPWE